MYRTKHSCMEKMEETQTVRKNWCTGGGWTRGRGRQHTANIDRYVFMHTAPSPRSTPARLGIELNTPRGRHGFETEPSTLRRPRRLGGVAPRRSPCQVRILFCCRCCSRRRPHRWLLPGTLPRDERDTFVAKNKNSKITNVVVKDVPFD